MYVKNSFLLYINYKYDVMKKPNISKKSRYKNGEIPCHKLRKFMITEDSKSFVFRSSYEYLFMLFCENSPNVKAWSSEPFTIDYYCLAKQKMRKYWIDFTYISTSGQKYLVEIKPEKDFAEVKLFSSKFNSIENEEHKRNYALGNERASNNYSKWVQAKIYANSIDAKFIVVTEKFLKMK